MAQLTVLTNRLSEIQEKNMGLFPRIFFDGVREINIEFDLQRTDLPNTLASCANWVKYDLKIAEQFHSANHVALERRYEALENAIRTLLWSDIRVSITINGNEVYGGTNGVPNKA